MTTDDLISPPMCKVKINEVVGYPDRIQDSPPFVVSWSGGTARYLARARSYHLTRKNSIYNHHILQGNLRRERFHLSRMVLPAGKMVVYKVEKSRFVMESGSTLLMRLRVGSFRYQEGGTFRVRSRLSFQLTFLLDWPASAMPHKTTTRSPSKKFITIALAPVDHFN